MTQTSKKVKKQKGKKDERFDNTGAEKASPIEEKTEAAAPIVQIDNEVSPKGQRVAKKKKSPKVRNLPRTRSAAHISSCIS